MKIIIPNLSTSNALDFCSKLPYYNNDDIYFFDVSGVKSYEPLPMLLTATAIRQFRESRGIASDQIQLLFNNDRNYTYACHMGFFQTAGFPHGNDPGEAAGSTTYIPITKLNITELQKESIESGDFLEQGNVIEKEAKRLSIVLSQRNSELQKLLQYLIREAIRNIPEHAETNDVWICGQYWRNTNIAEIAILDEGIGIFQSLMQNKIHRGYITSNEDALRWALKPGVSVAFDPARGQKNSDTWANSGFGLYMISEICKNTNGWFTFVSGEECLRVYSNNARIYGAHLSGTALGIRINTSNLDNCQSILSKVRKAGEDEAKTIKTAFKEASTPSKGLML